MRIVKRNEISILIVEDETVVRELLERTLTSEGYNVQTACDGEEAWQLIEENVPDIVISDAKMPKMDGYELLKKTKNNYPSIGFIVMTAFGDSYSIKEAMFHGAEEYIAKPFESIELTLIVERTCSNMEMIHESESITLSKEFN